VLHSFIRSNLKHVYKEVFLGHTVGLDDSYARPTDEELLQEYLKAVPELPMNEEFNLSKKVTELQEKLDDTKYLKAELQRKNRKLRHSNRK
jgi:hypothetical protein